MVSQADIIDSTTGRFHNRATLYPGAMEDIEVNAGGVLQIRSVQDFEIITKTPGKLVLSCFSLLLDNGQIVIQTTKEGISAVRDIRPVYERLARENPQYVFCQFASESIPQLAQKMNIFPVFRFYTNGKMIQQCYGGIELSLKTNFKVLFLTYLLCPPHLPKRAIVLNTRIIDPPKKKVPISFRFS